MQFTGLALRAVAKDQSLAGRESQPGPCSKIAHVFDARLAEFHDQEWFPKVLRDHVTDALQFIFNLAANLQAHRSTAERGNLRGENRRSGGPMLGRRWTVDVASEDAATCFRTTSQNLHNRQIPEHPAFEDLQQQSQGQVTYRTDSVDAAHLPCGLLGFRTIFTSFHHAQPEEALLILRDAVRTRQGIGVFEAASRNPITLFSTMLMFFGGFLGGALHTAIPAFPLVLDLSDSCNTVGIIF